MNFFEILFEFIFTFLVVLSPTLIELITKKVKKLKFLFKYRNHIKLVFKIIFLLLLIYKVYFLEIKTKSINLSRKIIYSVINIGLIIYTILK